MLELLFLLLPIAAAYGWYMGRRSVQQDKQKEVNRLSREYVTGVNFLLSDQRDKAVDLFLDMLKEESTTLEAHLTLGNLFRSRGEVEHAIRIHSALLESKSLTFEQRLLAVQQLGKDYMAAGLLDRAEEMFTQLIEEDDFQLTALQQLLTLYQSTSDWIQAINTAEKLVKLGKTELRVEIAHFYCELATQANKNNQPDNALNLLKKASLSDEQSVRVSMMYGRLLIDRADYANAVTYLTQVLVQDKEWISEILPMLHICYQHLQQPEKWEAFVRDCVAQHAGTDAALMLADIIEIKEGRDSAQIYVNHQVQCYPTMKGFHRLMDYHLAEAEEGKAKESLAILRNMVGEQIRIKPRYRCHKCGFATHTIYWHCPSCRHWATIKPIYGLDGQ